MAYEPAILVLIIIIIIVVIGIAIHNSSTSASQTSNQALLDFDRDSKESQVCNPTQLDSNRDLRSQVEISNTEKDSISITVADIEESFSPGYLISTVGRLDGTGSIDVNGKISDSYHEAEPTDYSTIKISGGLGNFLVEYFTMIAWFFVYNKDARLILEYTGSPVDWIDKLPTHIPYNSEIHSRLMQIPDVKKKLTSGYHRISDWGYNRGMLRAMIPLITKIFNDFILTTRHKPTIDSSGLTMVNSSGLTMVDPSDLTTPVTTDVVIHFRCSDGPRNRHPEYMFQRFKWYQRAMKHASIRLNKPLNDLSVTILSCSDWAGDAELQNRLCSKVASVLSQKLGTKNVRIQCSSLTNDFLTIVSAPCLISPGSSLSYIAALTNNNIMITPDFLHIQNVYYRDNWLILPADTLEHSEVPDYDNINDVLKRLEQ